MPDSITLRAPGKLTLQLSVGPRRSDGYHKVQSVFQAVSLHDVVTVERCSRSSLEVDIVGGLPQHHIPTGPDNLAMRAAGAFFEASGVDGGVRVSIKKEIPIAGGMAGGSADAAAVLVACDRLWKTGLGLDRLSDIARGVGSDVPAQLRGGTGAVVGRGDEAYPVLCRGSSHWVVACPGRGLPTADVYRKLDELRSDRGATVPPDADVSYLVTSALARGNSRLLGAGLNNDLVEAAAALLPEVSDLLATANEHQVLGSTLSGTGSTCAFLAESKRHAHALMESIRRCEAASWVTYASGPVPGPAIALQTRKQPEWSPAPSWPFEDAS